MKNHLIVIVFIVLFLGCNNKDTSITNLQMLEGGKTFAVPTGTAADLMVLDKFPDAKLVYLNSVLDCALAVKGGKADAAVYDLPVLKNLAAKNSGVEVLPDLLFEDQYGFAVQLGNDSLKNMIDSVLSELKNNGKYDEMVRRWFPSEGAPKPMPNINTEEAQGTLVFGTSAITEPMSFVDNNRNVVGFDIEFAGYVAQKLNKRLEIVDMEFGAMLPALISGKVDMIGAGLSITEERAQKVLFSECYYPSGIAALVKSDNDKSDKGAVKLRTHDDLNNKKLAVLMGSIHDTYAQNTFPNADIQQYQSVPDLIQSVNSGKADAAFYDQTFLKEVLEQNPELGVFLNDMFSSDLGVGFHKDNTEFPVQFNEFLAEIKANGTYTEMVDRWLVKGDTKMPDIENSLSLGELKVGVVSDLGFPFSFMQDGNLCGFDIELSRRFAAYAGKKFVPVDLQFGSLISSISTNKIDMIAASLTITEERKKQINFSEPYLTSGISTIALKKNMETKANSRFSITDDIADKKIGIFTGTVHDAFIANKYPQAEVFRYESTADLVISIKSGKIDVAMLDLITAKIMLKQNRDLGLLTDNILDMPLGVGFSKNKPELLAEFNSFLNEIRTDGTYDTIASRWFNENSDEATMPHFDKIESDRKIVVGIALEDLPYVAYKNGEYVGFDIEMLHHFALRNNYQLEMVPMEFASLVAALTTGKVDMITDGIAISEERAKQINFSDSYATFKTAVVAKKTDLGTNAPDDSALAKASYLQRIKSSFYSNLIHEKRYLLILDGLWLTVVISVFAALFGSIIGGFICFLRMSASAILSGFAKLYIALLRGTPVLVLLMIIYYVVFASVNINPVVVAIFAFGLNFGAYVSEMFRTSIESIDKGQTEAGIASGFTKIQTFIYIIVPQALRNVLPVYKGEFISLVKMTSIVGYIAVQDLTKASDIIRSRTFDAFFPLLLAAFIYLVIAWMLTWALGYVELSVDPKRKRTIRIREAKS